MKLSLKKTVQCNALIFQEIFTEDHTKHLQHVYSVISTLYKPMTQVWELILQHWTFSLELVRRGPKLSKGKLNIGRY